jgi:hypothetical protein
MAKTTTALAGAIAPGDWLINLVNPAALRAGDNIVVGTETMRALVVTPSLPVVVYRGARGTNGQAAANAAVATYGPPPDWGVSVGVTRMGLTEFEAEAEAEIAAEEAEKRHERVEKLAEKKAAEKKAVDDKAAAERKAADDKAARLAAANDKK